MKKILINNVITKRFPDVNNDKTSGFEKIKSKIRTKKSKDKKNNQKEDKNKVEK